MIAPFKSLKRFLPNSLLGRSLLILVTPILLIQIITTYVFFDRHWNRMSERLAFAVAGEIAVMADYIEAQGDDETSRGIADYARRYLAMNVLFVPGAPLHFDEIQHVKRDNPATEAKESIIYGFLSEALDKQVGRPYTIRIDIEEKGVQVAVALQNGVLEVSLPSRRLFTTSGYAFLLWMFGVSLVLLVVAILFMRNQIRPIRRLAIAAARFGKGRDVSASFKPEGAREVRQAAESFLKMQERIKRQIDQRTAMLSGVSHDLRTPLTRMKLQVEMLQACPDVDALKSDIADMETMIGAYLDFVRGDGEEQVEPVDVSVLLEMVVASDKTREDGAFHLDVAPGLVVPLRPVAGKRCLENLLGNARKYASSVWVTAARDEAGENLILTIDDDGPGIAPENREDVFKPFYRVESSRNLSTGGVGLGLPIAQDIIHAHGGEIFLEDSAHGGLRVRVTLPL